MERLEAFEAMLDNLFRQLAPGGELVCEMGGYGCAERVHSALEGCFAARGLPYRRAFYFPTIGQYAPMLERAGFAVKYMTLFDRPTVQNGPDGLAAWIRMFNKVPFRGLDDAAQEAVQRLRGRLWQDGHWVVDYVRLRFRAVRVRMKKAGGKRDARHLEPLAWLCEMQRGLPELLYVLFGPDAGAQRGGDLPHQKRL